VAIRGFKKIKRDSTTISIVWNLVQQITGLSDRRKQTLPILELMMETMSQELETLVSTSPREIVR